MARRPTQRQIAERLGLSPATVSLALRDSPMIAEETRKLVQTAIAESGYVPNVGAAALRTGRSRIVGVSFHNIAHQFFAEMLIAIEETLGGAGIAVFLNNHGERPESFARFVASLAAHGADGLLVSPPPGAEVDLIAPLKRQGVPVIYVSRRIEADEDADWVINADRTAMLRAAGRLLDLGHRTLALIGGQAGTTVGRDRLDGFSAALSEAGLTTYPLPWYPCRPRLIEGAEQARAALSADPAPTGLVCFNDLVAFGAMNAVRAMGLEPGRDIGVVGVGGTDEAAAYHPGLTTVLDSPAKIGRMAAETLLARLETPDAEPRQITLDPRLMVRESCGGPI
ncbi:MAG: LacI family DNA-binding transcriptional regulator [Pseudomonadota bacterium]